MFNNFEMGWKCNTGLQFHNDPPKGSGNKMEAFNPFE
jgi:hypothetical protein